ncbi:MAG: PQQ-binding-like beta-propeller repeat protein, partial [Pirellulaceae bacterium]|nr:PQQ-binding-like beta-propeller repeat protein [Pirellulaceae bacterium]
MRLIRSLAFAASLSFIVGSSVQAENWTRFRGANGQGVSSETDLPVTWSATENITWKTPLPGTGWSSPVVWGNRVFVTTATENGVSCRVISIDRDSGKVLWNTEVHRQSPGPMREQNSYATPTPVTDGQRVCAVFHDGTIVAVDFAGKLIWKNSDVDFHSLHGLGSSPILVDDLIVMPFDGSSREEKTIGWKVPWEAAQVVALDSA